MARTLPYTTIKEKIMAEQDVLDKIDDVLDKIDDNEAKLAAIEATTVTILKRAMSLVYTCRVCRGVGCSNCDNTGLLPRVSS